MCCVNSTAIDNHSLIVAPTGMLKKFALSIIMQRNIMSLHYYSLRSRRATKILLGFLTNATLQKSFQIQVPPGSPPTLSYDVKF